MVFGDLNVLMIFFFLLLSSLLINISTSLHLLLTAELLWITLYTIVLFVGLVSDNLNLLSLTFFFLIFSAVEFSVGLIILLLQHLFLRTLNLDEGGRNVYKFTNRYTTKFSTNRLRWKV